MLAYDADLVEINPLAVIRETTADGTVAERLVCLDAKVTLDDSALPRHPELEKLRDPDEEDPGGRSGRIEEDRLILLSADVARGICAPERAPRRLIERGEGGGEGPLLWHDDRQEWRRVLFGSGANDGSVDHWPMSVTPTA
jgi:hypothetical protein